MSKFRKKPVVIEAVQLTLENYEEIERWSGGKFHAIGDASTGVWRPKCGMVNTLEGTMSALFGDWIIKGIKGEFYRCDPVIFAETYESVED